MDIFKKYRQDNNKKALLKALKAHFQIKKIHKSIEPYIFGEVAVEGIFNIDTFEDSYQNVFTYNKLFDKLGSGIFPAVPIGGETYGVEFWLVMSNGKVISLHHDASFSEVAYDIETDNADYFVKEFSRQGRASGYQYATDEPAYLEHFKQYKSLKVLDFPEESDSKPDFFEQILEVAKTLPLDTFVWADFNFNMYNTTPTSNYIVQGLDQLTKIKHLVWKCSYKNEFCPFLVVTAEQKLQTCPCLS